MRLLMLYCFFYTTVGLIVCPMGLMSFSPFLIRQQLRSLHQSLTGDGTPSPLSLYTSPSLPNISLGLPANAHITVSVLC